MCLIYYDIFYMFILLYTWINMYTYMWYLWTIWHKKLGRYGLLDLFLVGDEVVFRDDVAREIKDDMLVRDKVSCSHYCSIKIVIETMRFFFFSKTATSLNPILFFIQVLYSFNEVWLTFKTFKNIFLWTLFHLTLHLKLAKKTLFTNEQMFS